MLATAQVSKTHSLQLFHLSQIRSNAALLEVLESGVGDLGLGDQLCASLVKGSKDVCSSLMIVSISGSLIFECVTYLGVDGESLGVGVVNGVTGLMVARILLNSSALIILSVKNHHTSISTYSVQESKRLVQSLPERSIVTSIGEYCRRSLNTLAGEVIDKDLLRHL